MARPVAQIETIQELLADPGISYLKVLTVPENPEVDVVAVHGLRIPLKLQPWKESHAFGVMTWIAGKPGEEVLWLKELLPLKIKNARVLLFGYNSNIGLDTSTAGVTGAADDLLAKLKIKRKDLPSRPIVFLCHSLGGIVVKHAISKARSTLEYKDDIYGHVRAIAFFATPHRGGLGAKLGQALAGALRHLTRNVRSSIMEALREDSLISSDIHRYFLDCLSDANIRVCSFYETKPLAGLSQLVVDKNSAMLGLTYPQEVTYPVPESDHSTICKYKSETQNYDVVISKIEELIDWALGPPEMRYLTHSLSNTSFTGSNEVTDSDTDSNQDGGRLHSPSMVFDLIRPSTPRSRSSGVSQILALVNGPFYLLPDTISEHFTGRETIIERLQNILSIQQNQQTRAALYGLGGVGKTQIALKVKDWYKEKYPLHSIFWVRGGNEAVLIQSFARIAESCGLAQEGDGQALPLEKLHRFLLDEENGRWLMIVDNADSAKIFNSPASSASKTMYEMNGSRTVPLVMLFPRCAHGQILFTTKSKAVGGHLTMQSRHLIEVMPMNHQESYDLLQKYLFESIDLRNNPPSYEREVPTAQDIDKLCMHLGNLPLALAQAAAFMRQQSLTVNEYIRLLEIDDSSLSDLLDHDFRSYGPEDDFSKAVASTWKVSFDQIEIDSPPAISLLSLMAFLDPDGIPKSLLRKFQTDEWQLTAKSLGILQGYALVNPIPGTESFKVHRMVQVAIRKRLASVKTATTWLSSALKLIANNFPYKSVETVLLPHAVQILKNKLLESMEDKLPIVELAFKVSWYYNNWGQHADAENFGQQAWESLKSVPDPPKELVLDVKATRVHVLRDTGRLKEGQELAQEVFAERRKKFGDSHKDTVESFTTLILFYQDEGCYKKAIKIARGMLKTLQKKLEADDISVLQVKARLGYLFHYLGDDSKGELLIRDAYDGYVKRLGSRDPLSLKTSWHLAKTIHMQARFEESMKISMESWKAEKSVFGKKHPETVKSQLLVATNLQALSDFKLALEYMRWIHTQTVYLLGSHHRYSLVVASSLASCIIASAQGKESLQAYEEAEELYRVVLAGSRQLLRNDHPETLVAKTGVATALRLRGQFDEAETLQREALEKLKRELGKEHPWFLDGQENLARILCEQKASKGAEKEAMKLAQVVLKKREKRLGWNHVDTKRIAEFVVQLLPSGQKREKLQEKVIQQPSATPAETEDGKSGN